MKQWLYFSAYINGTARYIGKSFCTLEDALTQIANDLPNRRTRVEGNHVLIF